MNANRELRWFYGESESALGLHGQNLERNPEAYDAAAAADRASAHVARYCDVTRRLRHVGLEDERVLRLAFYPREWPGLARWYELAGVGALLVNREDVIAGGRKLAAMPAAQSRPLRVRAEKTLAKALEAFGA